MDDGHGWYSPLSRPGRKKKWEVFPGKNRFFCGGRLVTSPDTTPFFWTIGLITVPFVAFLIFEYVRLMWCFANTRVRAPMRTSFCQSILVHIVCARI